MDLIDALSNLSGAMSMLEEHYDSLEKLMAKPTMEISPTELHNVQEEVSEAAFQVRAAMRLILESAGAENIEHSLGKLCDLSGYKFLSYVDSTINCEGANGHEEFRLYYTPGWEEKNSA